MSNNSNTTLYKALIENDDGIHVLQREVSDHEAEYEAFEIYCQNRADELDGDLFGPFADEDIVETVTVDDAMLGITEIGE